ncbi:MAG: hypothetical protein Q4D98_10280, partial [Planctomycetia bacterium]|nr:hypothetical protein [Planctomycetia bacterium]
MLSAIEIEKIEKARPLEAPEKNFFDIPPDHKGQEKQTLIPVQKEWLRLSFDGGNIHVSPPGFKPE